MKKGHSEGKFCQKKGCYKSSRVTPHLPPYIRPLWVPPGRCVGSVGTVVVSRFGGSQKGTSKYIILIINRHHYHSYLTVLPSYVVVCGVAPYPTRNVVGVPTKIVFPNACVRVSLRLCWVPILAALTRVGSRHSSNIFDTRALAYSWLYFFILLPSAWPEKQHWEQKYQFEFFTIQLI